MNTPTSYPGVFDAGRPISPDAAFPMAPAAPIPNPNAEKFFSALDACFCLLSHGKTLVETGWQMTEKDKNRVLVELQQLSRCAGELAMTIERKSSK